MKLFLMINISLLICFQTVIGQVFQVDTLLMNGPIDKRINLVILGDGYTQSQLPQFYQDAQNLSQQIFFTSPLAEYQSYFNVFSINVPSVESGVSHPNTASDCPASSSHPFANINNYFGSQFDYYGIHRLLVATNTSAISAVLANNFPMYDQVFIIANTTYYGGSGGSVATSSLHNSANEIAIHEIGHSFSVLADEYYAGDIYATERPNMTQDTTLLSNKWRNWLGDQAIGIYQHCCFGNSSQWYKPNTNCKMEYLGAPLCAVCKQTFTKKIHDLTNAVDRFSPSNTSSISLIDSSIFSLELIYPNPNTLNIEWYLNGINQNISTDSIQIFTSMLNSGSNTLIAQVIDTTSFIRIDTHTTHIETVQWLIDQTITDITVSADQSKKSIFLAPNPSHDFILVEFEHNHPSKIQFIIRNSNGQMIVRESNYIGMTGTVQHRINIENLPAGNYYLQIIDDVNQYFRPFIKRNK